MPHSVVQRPAIAQSADDERTTMGAKVLSVAAIGYLACKYITTINPTTGALFSALAMIVDVIAAKFIQANKTPKALISSGLSFMLAMSLTNYFAKFTIIQAIKITFYLTITQLALATLGAGILMGSFATLALIGTNKLLAKA